MQTPDLAVDRDPHRGADGIVTVADIAADLADVAVTADIVGNILIAASSGKIFTVSPDGETLKTIDTGAPIFGSPAVENDRIYVSDFSGRVSCIAY